MDWLRRKLTARKAKRIRRDLKKNLYRKEYLVKNILEGLGLGRTLFTLDSHRNNNLRPAKIYQNDEQILLYKVSQMSGIEVRIVELNNINLIARSDGFIKNNVFFHPDLLLIDKDRHDPKNQAVKLKHVNDTNHCAQIPKSLRKMRLFPGITISLIKEHSFNYYHFVYECLPKLLLIQEKLKIYFTESSRTKPITILIDQHVPEQCLHYINHSVSFSYEIERLASDEVAHCETLIYCSPFFNALDNTSVDSFSISDFYVDKYATLLVKKLADSMATDKTTPSKLIYLDRKEGQKRRILNSDEMKKLLVEYNFDIIFPDQFSIPEQIALFQSAICVVGASGAAFANIIHMQAGTTAVVLSPNLSLTNYHIFEQQAEAANVNLIHLQTNNLNKIKRLHDDSYVNTELLKSLFSSLNIQEKYS
tara:strand:- start:934 stop:2193 length:1260 start_codon:yes stop_codon:yes gene_type:complete